MSGPHPPTASAAPSPNDDVSAEVAGESGETPPQQGALVRLGRRLLVPLALAVVAVAALALYADGRELLRRLGQFDLALLAPVLALSLVNYAVRFVRWHLYLLRLDSSPGSVDSLWVFLVGFVLTVTPGKVGELGKAWLVRELGGGRARHGVAAVVAERLTDVVGVMVLVCLGTLAFPGWAAVAWTGLGLTLPLTALLAWPRAMNLVVGLLSKIPRLGERVRILVDVHDSLRRLLTPGMLAAGVALSIAAWGAEGLGFALVVSSYTGETAWLAGLFDYNLGTLVGGLVMLPGGLVAAEGTLTALLVARGLDAAAAASATLIVRAATLWFAFLLGLAALPILWMRMRRHRATKAGLDE